LLKDIKNKEEQNETIVASLSIEESIMLMKFSKLNIIGPEC
jgi:hypothetical protein